MKIATLNLWHNELERETRLRRVASFALDENLDVLCVQEVVPFGDLSAAEVLSEMSGLYLSTPARTFTGEVADVCILSKHKTPSGELVPVGSRGRYVAASVVPAGGEELLVISAHLTWGGTGAGARLDECRGIVGWVDEKLGVSESERPAVLCGDLNAEPHHEAVRYLTGATAHQPDTLWTDAWVRPAEPTDPGWTSSPLNRYARHTARIARSGRDAVVRDDMLPPRRIDYIMSRGWRHGRRFTPYNTRVVDRGMSDHYAVVCDLLT